MPNKSKLITDKNVLEYVVESYGVTDPVMCIWLTKEPPGCKGLDDGSFNFNFDDVILFTKEDVESLLFPKGIIPGQWNITIACFKSLERPRIGWIMGSSPESFMPSQLSVKKIGL